MTSADADEILGRAPVTRQWGEGYPTEGDVEVAGWLASGAIAPVTFGAPFGLTTDMRYLIDVNKEIRAWPHLRVHVQDGVAFWKIAYAAKSTATGIELPY